MRHETLAAIDALFSALEDELTDARVNSVAYYDTGDSATVRANRDHAVQTSTLVAQLHDYIVRTNN